MSSPHNGNRILTRRTPETFGRYTLLGRMAVGGMAEVFVARCGELVGMQTLIAVKRILPVHSGDDKFVQMFQREASIALRLSHRSIARVFEVGKHGQDWFLSMELVQGENLARVSDALHERGLRWDPALVAFIGAEVAQALAHAHALKDARGRPLNIVHRDISPENIMLGFDGSVKVIDFGIAMCESYASLTTQGAVRGKVQYVSPEQAQTQKLDGRSDLFSLGVVLYECLAGTQPFERGSPMQTLNAIVGEAAMPIPHVAPALNAAILRALNKDPDQRFADGDAFAQALLSAQAGEDAGPNKIAQLVSSLFPRRRERWREIENMAFEGFGFVEKQAREAGGLIPDAIMTPAPVLAVANQPEKETKVEKYYAISDTAEKREVPASVPRPDSRRRTIFMTLGGGLATAVLAYTAGYLGGRRSTSSPDGPRADNARPAAAPASPITRPTNGPAAQPRSETELPPDPSMLPDEEFSGATDGEALPTDVPAPNDGPSAASPAKPAADTKAGVRKNTARQHAIRKRRARARARQR